MTIYAGFDIETTGLLEPDHRIIEIHFEFRHNYKKLLTWTQRLDPKRTITAEAFRVHGIDLAMLAGKPTFEDVAKTIEGLIQRADVLVAHNGEDFDEPFLEKEFKRVGLRLPKKPIFDTMKKGRWATADGKNPNLGELCWSTGVDYDSTKAHAADYDVSVMLDAFESGYRMGFFSMDGLSINEQQSIAA
ncbi:DNA polymerase-3 subunit epsilon [Ochrobactrum sp. P20RRXII]|nr:3'-5' exonuclease [Ochrobactrum sp. P20RRXII]NIH77344.1 DNA polymerase-3 subunit epsilon [Ochrobactrum sp. P20RRXII]